LFRKSFVIATACLFLLAFIGFEPARAETPQDIQNQSKVKAKVQELGVGSNSRVEVKLKDQTKLKGYISAIADDSFTLTDSKSGATQKVSYADVSEVKKGGGGGLSTKTWIIIGAVGAGAVTTWLIAKPAVCDGGAQTRFPC
jgi:hypothetical protein